MVYSVTQMTAACCISWKFCPGFTNFSYSRRTSPLGKDKCSVPLKVISQVAEPDFTSSPGNTNTSQYHITGSLGLYSKDMLYSRTDLRPGAISLLFPFGKFPVTRTLALNMFTVSFLVQLFQLFLRTIRRISPYSTAGIVFIQQFIKHLAVMDLRTGHPDAADQFVTSTDMWFL